MVTDQQVRRLIKLMSEENKLTMAADKSGMDRKTARKYLRAGRLPSQAKKERAWRTRKDPFKDIWGDMRQALILNPGLEAKTLFDDLKRRYQGVFQEGQLRTLQRKIKRWRALEGSSREVYFPQRYSPGVLCESDFTHMTELGITIGGELYSHLIYHFVLPYSNWESGTICFSECFESLSEGLQNALWELGGVPEEHLTDRMTAAVNNLNKLEEFTRAYEGLLNHYRMRGRKIQTGKPNENGDVEQRHYRLKRAVEQALMLRGSHDFVSREEYESFLCDLFKQLNSSRRERFEEELRALRQLPHMRLSDFKELTVRVSSFSTIRVQSNAYSLDSRLIGELVSVRLYADKLEVRYAQKLIETLPRLRGKNKHLIHYRHVIESLVRKPGAFANYLYREDLFPSSHFRMAYDILKESVSVKADKEYLRILHLAAYESEAGVIDAIRFLIEKEMNVSFESIEKLVKSSGEIRPIDVRIEEVDLAEYDALLDNQEVA